MKDKLAFLLMLKVLQVVQESGANATEAECALEAARAMLPEAKLKQKPTIEIQTPSR
jgi:hypothetical protein